MAKVTIQSMARDLGLSRNTVSMALKGNSLVTKQTRDTVLRYAVKVGYLARLPEALESEKARLETEKEHRIIIIRKTDEAFYWDRVLNGITEEASRYNCRTQVAVVTEEEEKAGIYPPGLDEKIEAVIFLKLPGREYVSRIKKSGYRIFMLDDFCENGPEPLGDVVRVNGRSGVYALTMHLISRGMRRIGFLNENSHIYETMYDRYAGYLDAMAEAGLPPETELMVPDGQSDYFYTNETFDALVAGCRNLPEAVVCGNDAIALMLTHALRRRGLRVPEDIAVTGFDNDETGKIDPFFTTVQTDVKWLGRRVVQSFLWRLKYPDAPYEKVLVHGVPVYRASSMR